MAKRGGLKPMASRINVLENAVLVSLRFSNLGNRGSVDSNKVQTTADKKSLHVSKLLLDSSEYRAVMNHRANWRDWLESRSAPSALGGTATYVLPLALLPEVERENSRRMDRDRVLLEELVLAYPERVAEARVRLKEEFKEEDYLTQDEVRRAFAVHVNYLSISAPDALKRVSRVLYAREVEKFYTALDETAQKIDATLIAELVEMVTWMVDRVSDSADGKAKSFGKPFDERLTKTREFFRLLKHRNLTGNVEIDTLAEQAKALLDGVNADTVKKDEDFRKKVREGFAAVKVTLDEIVINKPSRRIVLEE